MNQEELIKYLESEGYSNIKEVPGRGLCGLRHFVFTIGLCHNLTRDSYEGRWCYPKNLPTDAIVAYEVWDGEGDPKGDWVKYKGRVEYSNPKLKEDYE
jgi:hypothetical protein